MRPGPVGQPAMELIPGVALPGTAWESLVRKLLEGSGPARLRVRGDCMQPCLQSGERVVLCAARLHPPRWGDIVLLFCPDGIRLHRLVWAAPGRIATKGDHSRFFDPIRSPGALLATVVGTDGSRPRRAFSWRRLRALRSLAEGVWNELRSWRRPDRENA